ncbi:MAG: hypothetical protein J6Y38_01485, partial [Bacteroidaceae bacterium]|nr:hypothetical protein [Bacteroidaceae bacterium]
NILIIIAIKRRVEADTIIHSTVFSMTGPSNPEVNSGESFWKYLKDTTVLRCFDGRARQRKS